jgi:hypothetical protein
MRRVVGMTLDMIILIAALSKKSQQQDYYNTSRYSLTLWLVTYVVVSNWLVAYIEIINGAY